jgi:polysaccharide biosynthesis/export protein VpsN
MRILTQLFVFSFLLCTGATLADQLSDYKLGSGDLIRITVFDEPDLSIDVRLSDAGTVSYPFLGELRASGNTLGHFESIVTKGLQGSYLVKPNVTVSILEYRPFYVNGEVEEAGGFAFVPGITVRGAIALAGGFTDRASRSKIFVNRTVDQTGVSTRTKMSLEDAISPGDVITVEQSFF